MSSLSSLFRGLSVNPVSSLLRGSIGKYGPSKGVPLSSKRAGKGYYKGKGVASIGRHTRKGKYVALDFKKPEIIAADLDGCDLKPYVAFALKKLAANPPVLGLPAKDVSSN